MNFIDAEEIQAVGDGIVARLLERFSSISANTLALTFRLYDTPLDRASDRYSTAAHYAFRADVSFYPASVCKLFYAVAAHAFVAEGRMALDDEDRRAMRLMIRDSSNEGTCYLLGRLTGTENGAVLDETAMRDWWERRQAVQRYFNGWGYPEFEGLRVWHGTYEESPYGREKAVRAHGMNRMSALAAATLMHDVMAGRAVSARASAAVREDMDRAAARVSDGPYEGLADPIREYMAQDIPLATRIWSKPGLTSDTRHDVVCFQGPRERSCIAAIFTSGAAASADTKLLPAFGREVAALLE